MRIKIVNHFFNWIFIAWDDYIIYSKYYIGTIAKMDEFSCLLDATTQPNGISVCDCILIDILQSLQQALAEKDVFGYS